MINLIFAAFGRLLRPRTAMRPAVSPPVRPAVKPVSTKKAASRIIETNPSALRQESPRKTATQTQRKTEPVESPKPSGGRVGGKAPDKKPTTVGNDTTVLLAPVFLKGPQKNTVISLKDTDPAIPPPPMSVTYEMGQTGSSKRLDMYKKMYKGSTYELATPTLLVGGTGDNKDRKFRPSTMAGFGRKNVFWPYWLHDHYSPPATCLTSKTSCFNRSQIEGLLYQMWEGVGITDSNLLTFLTKLENTVGGDVRVDFPLDYIECEYKYFNNNAYTPIDLALYICSPTRNMTGTHSPMYDWFNPGSALDSAATELMIPDYYYEPVLTAADDVMFQYNTAGTPIGIGLKANKDSILTASTEVVPEATPQGFSAKFRRNWDVKHVQHFHLQPQQELLVTFRVKMSKLIDLKKLLAYESGSDQFQLFKDLTLFPMVTFQGQDNTAVSKNLMRTTTATDAAMNWFLDTTAPRSTQSMLSSSMTARARVHTKSAPLRAFDSTYTYTMGDILDVVNVSKRDLLSYKDPERGEQAPYYQVNNLLGSFCGLTQKPSTDKKLTTILSLNLKSNNSVLSATAEPSASYLSTISTDVDWEILSSRTISSAFMERTSNDLSS